MRPHLLPRGRLCALLVSCLLGGLLVAGPAQAEPADVILDYGDNGRLDQRHSPADLRGALALAADNPAYGAFADVVSAALDRELLGIQRPEPEPERTPASDEDEDLTPAAPAKSPSAPDGPAPGTQTTNEIAPSPAASAPSAAADQVPPVANAVPSVLPAPPLADPDSNLPLPFIILTSLAVLLLLSGVGAAVHRRLAR